MASRAGVSTAAVSFAVNGLPGVGDETRRRILRVAEDLGWQPSTRAQALRRSRAGAIGLVLARDPDELELDPFAIRFLVGIERTLARHDYALLLQLIASPTLRVGVAPYRRLANGGRVDGFLVVDPQRRDPRFAMLATMGLPAVVIGQTGRPCPLPVLETQHVDGMRQAVDHLIALGHRRIGFVGGLPSHEHVHARRRIWRATMRKAGLQPGPALFAAEDDLTAAAATARVLEDSADVTAIAYTTDMLAVTGHAVALAHGRRVPQTLSITGLDDSPLAVPAGLTSVAIDYTGLGEGAAAHLMALIAGEPPPPFVPAPARLQVRRSTAPPHT